MSSQPVGLEVAAELPQPQRLEDWSRKLYILAVVYDVSTASCECQKIQTLAAWI